MRSPAPRPLLVVDLGVPRNVEPAAGKVENVFLHTIDSLDHLIQRNLKRRKEEVPKVEEIIEQELAHFRAWFRGLDAEPLIARLQKRAEKIRRQELAEALPRFPRRDPRGPGAADPLAGAQDPPPSQHPAAHPGRWRQDLSRLDLVRELFHLDDERRRLTPPPPPAGDPPERARPGAVRDDGPRAGGAAPRPRRRAGADGHDRRRGDRATSPRCGGKGLFTQELESGLLDGSLDLAVHSLKDLPVTLPDRGSWWPPTPSGPTRGTCW